MAKDLEAALSLHRSGQLEAAEEGYRRILEDHPANADALHLLGVVRLQRGDGGEAVRLISEAVVLKPDSPGYYNNLGNAFAATERLSEAVDSFRKALELEPEHTDAHSNMSAALHGLHRFADAEEHARRALKGAPDNADALFNLANTLRDQGRVAEALEPARRAVAADSGRASFLALQGSVLKDMESWSEALPCLEQAAALDPASADIQSNLANALCDIGRLTEAEAANRRSLELKADDAKVHSNLLFTMHYNGSHSPEALFAEAGAWRDLHAARFEGAAHDNPPDPDRSLRIGYVSGDLRRHSVGYFMDSVLSCRPPDAGHVTCYSNSFREDPFSERLRGFADGWHNILALSDEAVTELIRGHRIDVLVDLSGHSKDNRLLVFARKPAPVQVTYLGYPGTTGLEAMDYRLTDSLCDPEAEAGRGFTETLVRLDGGFLCYTPPPETPAVSALPADSAGYVTFGSFNNLSKVNPEVVAAWARILESVPDSRLLMKNKPLGDATVRARYAALFKSHGIAPERLEFLGNVPDTAGHMGVYGRIDIGLDPFPYNGTTTTLEAAWMGVPVVSLAGDRHSGRVGLSLGNALGLPQLAAKDARDYVETAARLAGNREELARLRGGLRQRLADSALMDGPGFAEKLAAAYRGMWRQWCASVAGGGNN